MLVLSRKRDEVICIGPDIEVIVVEIRGDKVRLGVKAPRDVQVHRKEVLQRILAVDAPPQLKNGCPRAEADGSNDHAGRECE